MTTVYIRILDIDTGSMPASERCKLIAYIGTHDKSFPNPYKFKNNNHQCRSFTWKLPQNQLADNAFSISLYKRRIINGDRIIGKLSFNISAFPLNNVTRKTFYLRSPVPRKIYPSIKIEVHVTDRNNVIPFSAPIGKISKEFEFKKTNNEYYFQSQACFIQNFEYLRL